MWEADPGDSVRVCLRMAGGAWCGPRRLGWAGRLPAEEVPGAVPDALDLTGEAAERWRAVRQVLTVHRHELGRVAARLYPEVPRVASADLLCREEWVPAAPLRLDDLALHWDAGGPDQDAGPGHRGGAGPGAGRYAEGRVITGGGAAGIPFTAGTVDRLAGGREPFQAAGAALLRLAWEHRKHLLG